MTVHGTEHFIKFIDGVPHIPEKTKKGFVWTPTVVDPGQLARARKTNDVEIICRFTGRTYG